MLQEEGLKVMLLGLTAIPLPSPVQDKRALSATQSAELYNLMHGKNQVLDLVDENPLLLSRLKEIKIYDHTPISTFLRKQIITLVNDNYFMGHLMQPRPGIELKTVQDILHLIFNRSEPNRPFAEQRYICWTPQPPSSDLPLEINDTYHVIVATCTSLFPKNLKAADATSTWLRVIALLKNRGTLYVDSSSYDVLRKLPNMREHLEEKLGCRLVATKLRPLVQTTEDAKKDLLDDYPSAYDDKGYKHYILQTRTQENGELGLFGATTFSAYAIERVIDKVEALNGLFKEATSKNYWHFVAKNFRLAALFTNQQLKEKEIPNYNYFSKPHRWTPLHVAVLSNNPEAVKFFLAKDSSAMQMPDKDGMTPADYARIYQPHLFQRFWPELQALHDEAAELPNTILEARETHDEAPELQNNIDQFSKLLEETKEMFDQHSIALEKLLSQHAYYTKTLESYDRLHDSLEQFEAVVGDSDNPISQRLQEFNTNILLEMEAMSGVVDIIRTELPSLEKNIADTRELKDKTDAFIEKCEINISQARQALSPTN